MLSLGVEEVDLINEKVTTYHLMGEVEIVTNYQLNWKEGLCFFSYQHLIETHTLQN